MVPPPQLFGRKLRRGGVCCSYPVDPAVDGGITVGCVLRVSAAGSGARDGVHVTRVNPLDSTLVLAVNEELVSNIISIRAVSQVRARVTCLPALPHFLLPLQRLLPLKTSR